MLLDQCGVRNETSLTLCTDLDEADWLACGRVLAQRQSANMWWIGDWWTFGEKRFGRRSAIVKSPGWHGPAHQTCRNAALVVRAFDLSRRRDKLSFGHHAEVAHARLTHEQADALLQWAIDTGASVQALRRYVKESHGDLESLSPAQVLEKLLAMLAARGNGRNPRDQAKRVCREDIALARRVLRGEVTLHRAHEMVRAALQNKRELAAANNAAAQQAAVEQASNVHRLPTLEERDAEAKRTAHAVAQSIATLNDARNTHIAPIYLMRCMSDADLQTLRAHTGHVFRWLKYILDTLPHHTTTTSGATQ